jgi:hypothetical protein
MDGREPIMADIEKRLARLEDRAELQDLAVRYFLAADGDDLEGLASCFAPEARFSVSGQLCGDSRDGIVRFLVGERAKMGLTVHTPHYALFTFTSDELASGLVGAHLELVLGGQSLFGAVRYQDDYVRRDGRWQISARDMRTIHIAPWSEVGASLMSATPVRWPGIAPGPSDFPRRKTA